MLVTIIYASVALVTLCYLSDWLFSLRDKPGAPPRAKSPVPLFGHLLGIIKFGTTYYTHMSTQQRSEVYTIGIFNFRIYVINSRRLIPLVQRLSKTLSFTPFQQLAAKVFVGCSSFTVDLHANPQFMRDFDRATRVGLAPGPYLDHQNLKAVNTLKQSLEKLLLGSSVKDPVRIPFYKWSRHAVTLAATNGVWGSSSPFLDPKVEEAFWTWNDGLPTMIAGLSFLAPKALKARQELINTFKSYISGGYQDAAEFIKDRTKIFSEYKVPTDDIARQLVSFNVALLSNTAPTAFWTLYNIFSRPELLQELRIELEEFAVIKDKETAQYELDLIAVKTQCPLLLSVFQETQRTRSVHANIRAVLENTTLDTYYLKKGSYLQIPNAPIHDDAELWGADTNVFNPRRFIKDDGILSSSSLPSNSFLAWGAAPHLCPARQFASTEILAMAALLIMRVEIEPVGGKWKKPELKMGDLVVMLPPKKDLEVEVRPREQWNGKWAVKMGESNSSKVQLASG